MMIAILLVRLCFAIVHIFTSIININIINVMMMINDSYIWCIIII